MKREVFGHNKKHEKKKRTDDQVITTDWTSGKRKEK